ncbi:HlyD family efflux transporter periplasmic adaptor subunit [Myxococcus sp. AM001]|uniref:HlyD family secretion protein n=1 Tax=Myxococcus vastator TaxID=2709664 RepID=UPI0013D896DE|nr:HlyD family efflux transporter periplasmic adaptor subunit [Myxococcus vastator]NVJ06177.1 HlyD family efflux transporter periplasmic adaptor subunit [Myxococcus sp. AM001]
MRKTHRLGVAAAGVLGLLASGCHGPPPVERNSVVSGPAGGGVQPMDVHRVVAPGIVEPWGGAVELAAQESGRVAEVLVHEGQPVTQGEVLARLEDEAQRHAITLARAELAEAEAVAERYQRGATSEERAQARAEHEAAASRAKQAAVDAERALRLKAAGTTAAADTERATSEARALEAAALAAEAKLQAIERGPRREDRKVVQERLQAARARLRQAEAALARRQVLAPLAATVLWSRFQPGELYTQGPQALFVLGDTSRMQVRLEVDEIDAPRVEVGMPCVLYTDGGARLAEGRVVRLSPIMGRRGLTTETPTARADVRIREVFVEVQGIASLVPGQRVWGHTGPRSPPAQG